MTTPPVVSVTDDLIAELERASKFTNRFMVEVQPGSLAQILSERTELKRQLAESQKTLLLWQPIMDEVDRRADKQWCISSKCDFTVTVFYDDYVKIDAAMQP